MSGRSSIAQLEALVEFLEQNPGIAKGQLRTTQAKQETKRKWASLASTLNALGGASKNGAGWAKYWAEKKCALKRQCSEHTTSMRCTGGGIDDNLPSLSPLDLRLMEVMGGRGFAVRDSQLAVGPFFQSISQLGTPAPSDETERGDIIIRHPSTSPENVIHIEPIILETISVRSTASQPQPIRPIPTQSQSQPVQSPRRGLLRSPRRPRRVRPSPLSHEMDRTARLEESRVVAETVTTHVFANATEKLDRCAAALEQLSEAVREGATTIANALIEIARSRTPHT